jgi:hypothetical protein
MLLTLLGNALKDLLKLLKLRRHDGKQLLQVRELLLMQELQLLELLRNHLQQLHNLLQRLPSANSIWRRTVAAANERIRKRLPVGLLRKRLCAESLAAPWALRHGIDSRCSNAKHAAGQVTHSTSSVLGGSHRSLSDSSNVASMPPSVRAGARSA